MALVLFTSIRRALHGVGGDTKCSLLLDIVYDEWLSTPIWNESESKQFGIFSEDRGVVEAYHLYWLDVIDEWAKKIIHDLRTIVAQRDYHDLPAYFWNIYLQCLIILCVFKVDMLPY